MSAGSNWATAAGLGVLMLCCGGHVLLGLGAFTVLGGFLSHTTWLAAGGVAVLAVGALFALRMLRRSRVCCAKDADSTGIGDG